jgi:hypothetical protein
MRGLSHRARWDSGTRLCRYLSRAVIVGILVALAVPARADAAVFTVAPARVEIAAVPGEARVTGVRVTNSGASELTVEVSTAGYKPDADGGVVFTRPASSTTSCAGWMTVSESRFSLAPAQSRDVTVTISVPSGASAGPRDAVVLVEGREASATPLVVGRVSARFFVDVDSPGAQGSAMGRRGVSPTILVVLGVLATAGFAAGVTLLLVDRARARRMSLLPPGTRSS